MADLDKGYVSVGICGLGTVGGGTLTVLAKNSQIIAQRATDIRVTRVAERDLNRAKMLLDQLALKDVLISSSWQEVVADPDLDIVVELIGRVEVAHKLIAAALKAGKSVVTANKDLMSAHGGELLALAEANGTDLFFEASVGGGIPIIQSLKESFAANRIMQVMGIVNGTTNYILTSMSEKGTSFKAALKEAQELGYAEADPTNDVEGYDAARKIAILASIAFNSQVSDDMVPTEGITGISNWDIAYAAEFGYAIKMLAIASCDEQSVEVRVHPAMIRTSHPLAAVRDSYNAVFVVGDAVENSMLYGRGAGALPTGSAVVGDIINAARNYVHNSRSRWSCTCYRNLPVKPLVDTVSKYYLRMECLDQPGVVASFSTILGNHGVSLDAMMQKRRISDDAAEIVVITHAVRHSQMMEAVTEIHKLDSVKQVSSIIRVEDQDA